MRLYKVTQTVVVLNECRCRWTLKFEYERAVDGATSLVSSLSLSLCAVVIMPLIAGAIARLVH